jgi:hypothetical protein
MDAVCAIVKDHRRRPTASGEFADKRRALQ